RGMTVARRPPKMIALIGTPSGFSQSGEMQGHCRAGAVKRLLGWAAGEGDAGGQGWPRQSARVAGGAAPKPPHHTVPSGRRATLVKIVFARQANMALGFVR